MPEAPPPTTTPARGGETWASIVGDNVRRLRKTRGLTQAQVAEAAGLDLRYLGSIERGVGNPSVEMLGRLASALTVHPADFFAGWDV